MNLENTMITAEIHGMVEAPWLDAPCVRVGEVPSYLPTPDAYVTVTDNDEPLLRVDVYAEGPAPFREALIWESWIVIGVGYDLHLVRPEGGSTKSVSLGFYFGHLYPMEDRLLVASGDKLFCLTPDGGIAWVSKDVGLDGVIVDHVEDNVVYGQGEWDPPGGWEPFQVSLTTGAVMKGHWVQ